MYVYWKIYIYRTFLPEGTLKKISPLLLFIYFSFFEKVCDMEKAWHIFIQFFIFRL